MDYNQLNPKSKAPSPQNVTKLRAFLGLINYYWKFLSHLSTTVAPLHMLLAKGTKWECGKPQQKAFDEVKLQLTSCNLLVHCDPDIQLVLFPLWSGCAVDSPF